MDVSEEEMNESSLCSEELVGGDCSNTNGLQLSHCFIPEEVIAIILNFLSWRELLPCRLVCQNWKEIVDSSVRHEKMKNSGIWNLVSSNNLNKCSSAHSFGHLPFYVNYTIGTKFGKNLLKNPFGNVINDKFDSWKVTCSYGDGWEVEEVPQGCDPLPETLEGRSCFVTSYGWGYKEQMINLESLGLNSKIMDEIQPDIKISEWYAARFDCGSKYSIKVCLLSDEHQLVKEFEKKQKIKIWQANVWNEVTHTFSDYGPGVRYILFTHGGCDTQYWAGHYGSKMAGGKVVALLPQRILGRIPDSSQRCS